MSTLIVWIFPLFNLICFCALIQSHGFDDAQVPYKLSSFILPLTIASFSQLKVVYVLSQALVYLWTKFHQNWFNGTAWKRNRQIDRQTDILTFAFISALVMIGFVPKYVTKFSLNIASINKAIVFRYVNIACYVYWLHYLSSSFTLGHAPFQCCIARRGGVPIKQYSMLTMLSDLFIADCSYKSGIWKCDHTWITSRKQVAIWPIRNLRI